MGPEPDVEPAQTLVLLAQGERVVAQRKAARTPVAARRTTQRAHQRGLTGAGPRRRRRRGRARTWRRVGARTPAYSGAARRNRRGDPAAPRPGPRAPADPARRLSRSRR